MQALVFAEVQQHFADTEAGTSPSPHHSRAAARADVLQLQQLAQHNSTNPFLFHFSRCGKRSKIYEEENLYLQAKARFCKTLVCLPRHVKCLLANPTGARKTGPQTASCVPTQCHCFVMLPKNLIIHHLLVQGDSFIHVFEYTRVLFFPPSSTW